MPGAATSHHTPKATSRLPRRLRQGAQDRQVAVAVVGVAHRHHAALGGDGDAQGGRADRRPRGRPSRPPPTRARPRPRSSSGSAAGRRPRRRGRGHGGQRAVGHERHGMVVAADHARRRGRRAARRARGARTARRRRVPRPGAPAPGARRRTGSRPPRRARPAPRRAGRRGRPAPARPSAAFQVGTTCTRRGLRIVSAISPSASRTWKARSPTGPLSASSSASACTVRIPLTGAMARAATRSTAPWSHGELRG